jgi:hypothetical protein
MVKIASEKMKDKTRERILRIPYSGIREMQNILLSEQQNN